MTKNSHVEVNRVRKMILEEYKIDNLLEVDELINKYSINFYNNKFKLRQFKDIQKELNYKMISEGVLEKYREKKSEIEEKEEDKNLEQLLCVKVGNYIVKFNAKVTEVLEYFKISKSKYYKLKKELEAIDPELYQIVQNIAKTNMNNILAKELEAVEPNSQEGTIYDIEGFEKEDFEENYSQEDYFEESEIKKRNVDYVIEHIDEKIEILIQAVDVLEELTKNNRDYDFLMNECIRKTDVEEEVELHRIENKEKEECFNSDEISEKIYETRKKQRKFKDFKKVIENFRGFDVRRMQKLNRDVRNYDNEEREYQSCNRKLVEINNNINRLSDRFGIK
ncbi:MAG: hypothetical protein ACK5LT_05690 [Lachnospirales bacterium]